jgi:hypothetical protein
VGEAQFDGAGFIECGDLIGSHADEPELIPTVCYLLLTLVILIPNRSPSIERIRTSDG